MAKKKTLNPGSKEAIKAGCLCPVMDNRHGLGSYNGMDGTFWISGDCPLHAQQEQLAQIREDEDPDWAGARHHPELDEPDKGVGQPYEECPLVSRKVARDETYLFCSLVDKICLLESNNSCEEWERIKQEGQ